VSLRTVQRLMLAGQVPGAVLADVGWTAPDLEAAVAAVQARDRPGAAWAGVTRDERERRKKVRAYVMAYITSDEYPELYPSDLSDKIVEMCGWEP
jgi:hypothetical protein